MTRTEFLTALEQLLASLPYEERRDALAYYEDYLDAAGPEHEAQAIAELGTPEEVARKILDEQDAPASVCTPAEPSSAPAAPAHSIRNALNYGRMVLGISLAVLVVCILLFQHSSAKHVQPEPSASSAPAASSAETPAFSSQPSYSLVWDDSDLGDAAFPRPVGGSESQSTFQIPLEKLNERLKLDFSYGSVVFVIDPDAAFATFQFDNFEGDHLTRSTDGTGKLTFRYDLSNYIKVSDVNEANLTITLPETALKELDVHIASGDLDLGTLQVDELDVELTSGDFSADTLTAKKFRVSQTSGDFSVQQLTAASVEASTTTGDIHIGLLSGGEDISFSAISGDFDVTLDGSPSDYYIRANVMMGNHFENSSIIENSDPNNPRKLQLRVVSGNTALYFTKY